MSRSSSDAAVDQEITEVAMRLDRLLDELGESVTALQGLLSEQGDLPPEDERLVSP